MKFSIIIGTYNQLTTLPKLFESLERQTFKDFETLVCDDGSNDGTKEYFDNFCPTFPLKYFRQWHRGMRLAKNINQGIRRAKGEYCLFVMADSFLETNYLELLNEWAIEDRIICGARINIEKDRIVELDYRLRKEVIPQQPVLLVKEPFNLITGNGLCVPTSALKEGWCEKIKAYGGDDNELVARLYYKGYLVWSVPQLILYHHYHFGTETPQKNINLVDKLLKQYVGA